jgi:hypothetical protein
VEVSAAIDIADATTITIQVDHADAKDGSYTKLADIYSVTASGATNIAAGEELANFVLPDSSKAWTRVTVATTDAAATGSITGYLHYLPR